MPWMPGVTRQTTENRHAGRECGGVKGQPIFVVWHYTVRDFEWSLRTLTSGAVSAHFLVDVDGSIHQLVDTDDAAWTQGVLCANERDHLLNVLGGICKRLSSSRSANENLWAIGVEIVNSGSEPYPPPQIEACVRIADWCRDAHRIERRRPFQVGHEEIDLRKSDPGGYFPWDVILETGQ